MTTVDKQIPRETLETLLTHKKEVLDNISAHYQAEMTDANVDSEKLFRYGFIFATFVQTTVGAVATAVQKKSDVFVFTVTIFFVTIAIAAVLYERIRIEKAELRRHVNSEREPIIQQISLLKGFLEPEEKGNV